MTSRLDGQSTFIRVAKSCWKTNADGLPVDLIGADALMASDNTLSYVRFLDDFPVMPIDNIWDDTHGASRGRKIYVVQTDRRVIERCF